jgi:acyl-CoA dehydrogenase
MYDLSLTAEQLEIAETIRDFVDREVKPAVLHPDRLQDFNPPLHWGLLDQASRMGLRLSALSEAAGGAGAGTLTSCIILEELACGDVDLATIFACTARLGHALFDVLMTPAQREDFRAFFLSDDRFHLALAASDGESDSGWFYHRPRTTPFTVPIRAIRAKNGDWVISGKTALVTNASIAKLIVVQVTSVETSGTTLLIVPRATAGISVEEDNDIARAGRSLLKWHHGAAARLVFEDCRVPAKQLLGEEGRAEHIMAADAMRRATPETCALNLGVGRAAYEAALDYTKLRWQGGRKIVEHEAIGLMLADMAVRLEAARNLVWKSAWQLDHPEAAATHRQSRLALAAMARVFTADTVNEVALAAAECFGGMGVMREMPLQKWVHDSLVFQHGPVSNSAEKLRIAEMAAGYER